MVQTYKLTHEYSNNKLVDDVYFTSKLTEDELVEKVAYIQFLTDEILHASELNELDIVKALKMYYDQSIEIIEMPEGECLELDMYLNWEFNCSNAEAIISNPNNYRKGLEFDIIKTLQVNNYMLDLDLRGDN